MTSSVQPGDDQPDKIKLTAVNCDIQTNQTAIMELTAQVSTFTKHLSKLAAKAENEEEPKLGRIGLKSCLMSESNPLRHCSLAIL